MDDATFGYFTQSDKRKEYPTALDAEKGARRAARRLGERVPFYVWWGDAEAELGSISSDGKHSDLTFAGSNYL